MRIVRFKHNFLWLEILPRKLSLVSENNDLERFFSIHEFFSSRGFKITITVADKFEREFISWIRCWEIFLRLD